MKQLLQTIQTDKFACLSLTGMLFLLVILYIYMISATVAHVVIRKEIHQDALTLQSEISILETKYIEAQHRVSDDIASLEGYQPVVTKVFIDRETDSLVLGSLRP